MMMNTTTNPLLTDYDLPPFDQIKPEHIMPAVETVLAENRAAIDALTAENQSPTWENFIEPLEVLGDKLHRVWSPVCHLHAVLDSPALRHAYHAALPKISEYHAELGQHQGLYEGYQSLANSQHFKTFTTAQQMVINHALRDFLLSGVTLPEDKKTQYRRLCTELSKLTSQFSDNVLDTTQAWTKHITDKTQLAGLPEHTIATAATNATEKGLTGWLLTLDFPCYYSVMTYADDRKLRETVYIAYNTRASDPSTTPLIFSG
jgi:oligopeptidase A